MERKARAHHDWKWVRFYQQKQAEFNKPGPTTFTPETAEYERDPLSPGSVLYGGGVEPQLAALSGAIATPLAGYAGMVKGGLINPIERAIGKHPDDAAELVKQIEGWAYQPKTLGGQAVTGAAASPFTALHEHVTEPAGRFIEEKGAGTPFAPLANVTAAMTEAVPETAAQVLAGRGLGRMQKTFSPREAISQGVEKVSPKAAAAIRREPEPKPVKELRETGTIVPSIGQRFSASKGGVKSTLGRWEELLTRRPLIGAWARRARSRPVVEYAWEQLNRARRPVGLDAIEPEKMSMHDALALTEKELDDIYNRRLVGLRGNAFTPNPSGGWPRSLYGAFSDVLANARPGSAGGASRWSRRAGDLNPLTREVEYTHLENIVKKLTYALSKRHQNPDGTWYQGGEYDGFQLREFRTFLREEKANFRKGGAYERELVPYIMKLQQAFNTMIETSNPGAVAELNRMGEAWAQFKFVQDAATRGGALGKAGMFSPQQSLRSVERRTRRKGDMADTILGRGEAQGQKLAMAAAEVLGNRVPGSGTPEALLAAGELGGDLLGAGAETAATGIPTGFAAKLATLLGVMPAFYSRGMQNWMMQGSARGFHNFPFTDVPMAGAAAAGAPTGLAASQRSQQYLDEQMAQQLEDMKRGLEIPTEGYQP